MKQSIHVDITIRVRWNDNECNIIKGMNDEISRFHPTGPLGIEDFGPYKQSYKEWELQNLNFLLGKMLERWDETGEIDDYNGNTYDMEIIQSMFDETEKAIENHDKKENQIDEIADSVN